MAAICEVSVAGVVKCATLRGSGRAATCRATPARHWLRHRRLDQTAYSLHLFVRDVAGADLVGWAERQLKTAAEQSGPDRLAKLQTAPLEPIREAYGVSDKVLI